MSNEELLAAIRENTEAVKELGLIVRGLTTVLIEDRDQSDPGEPEPVPDAGVGRYMDGTPKPA